MLTTVLYCYIVFIAMKIIINTTSMIPIYEQIVDIIKRQISTGELCDGNALPSVRSLAKDLKISALTVKKAYDELEAVGLIATVHGKGSYVKVSGNEWLAEEQRRLIETELETVYQKAKLYGISAAELKGMLNIITEA